jgi:hypothetical protein
VTKKAAREQAEALLESLDHDAITAAIRRSDFSLAEFDLAERVGKAVWAAGVEFLVEDLLDDVDGVEEEGTSIVAGQFPVNYVFDIRKRIKGETPLTSSLAGKSCIVDWKTTKGDLDPPWVARHTDSWQWKIYLYISGCDVFEYRGINWAGRTRRVFLPRPANLAEQVEQHFVGAHSMRSALKTLDVWPMRMPGSCYAYGRRCRYLRECQSWTMPRGVPEKDSFSHSSIDTFLLCPERYRRDKLTFGEIPETHEERYDAELGSAVHRGLEEVYLQAVQHYQSRNLRKD